MMNIGLPGILLLFGGLPSVGGWTALAATAVVAPAPWPGALMMMAFGAVIG